MAVQQQVKQLLHLRKRPAEIYAGMLLQFATTNQGLLTDPETLSQMIREKNWEGLLTRAERPNTVVNGAAPFFAEAQLSSLIKKYPFTPKEIPGINRELAALTKFLAAERKCRRINRRLSAIGVSRPEKHHAVLNEARRWILRVLGDEPNIRDVYQRCTFGPGASIGVHGSETSFARKLIAESWTVTRCAIPYALGALWNNHHTREFVCSDVNSDGRKREPNYANFHREVWNRLCITEANKIITVPKTARTDRTIAVEPTLNTFLQQGVGVLIADLLRCVVCSAPSQLRRHIDITRQDANQQLARLGSKPAVDPYVTLDLSSASDSVSIALCRLLLPPKWVDLLMDLRTQDGMWGGARVHYSKMSSMGNGFTFPLETLIFSAVCHAVAVSCHQVPDYQVYGDDIILRQNLSLLAVEVLGYLGFSVNRAKSYFHGTFRESCGADWLWGMDVRPIVCSDRLDSIEKVYAFHNVAGIGNRAHMLGAVRTFLRSKDVWHGSPHKRPFWGLIDSALEVPMDEFMASRWAKWCPHTQTWHWQERRVKPVEDFHDAWENSATLLTIAALRGSTPSLPYALRRIVEPVAWDSLKEYSKAVLRDVERRARCICEPWNPD